MDRKINILHLEDSLKDSELIHSIIESGDIEHDYFLTDNEKDFTQILENENIDIILSDYSLPNFNGNDALKVASEKYPLIPFIFVSGTIGEDYAIDSMLNGATDYVLKNKLARLVSSIKRALHEHELKLMQIMAGEALKESEEKFRNYIEFAPNGVFIVDDAGHYIEANISACRITGYSREELKQMFIHDLIADESSKEGQAHFKKLTETGSAKTDIWHKHKNGSKLYLTIDAVELSKTRFLGFFMDITERKLAEDNLKISLTKYQVLFDSFPLGITISDKDGNIIESNQKAEVLLGLSQEEQLKRQIKGSEWCMIRSDGTSFPQEEYASVLALKENRLIENVEMGLVKGENNITWLNVTAAPIPVENYGVAIAYSDITDRKLAEETLRESETRYRSLFENSLMGISMATPDGHLLHANQAYASMYGYESPEKMMVEINDISQLYANQDARKEVLNILASNGYLDPMEVEVVKRDGTHFFVLVSAQEFKDVDGKLLYFQANHIDITERKQVEEKLLESINSIKNINKDLIFAKDKAEESDKLKSAFLANMSHEIRTPLNAIIGFSGLLTRPDLTKENLTNFVQIINTNSEQLLSVISDVLDISKIDAGQFTIDSELVDINKLLTELFVTYRIMANLKKLSLEYSCDRPNEFIQTKTDGNRIKQVICNLLNNAIKFTKEGKIEFGYKIKNNFIEFYVKDTGKGIDPEYHTLVFERFRQVDAAKNQINSGNGLGLSISKAIAEKLRGTITLNSELGKGSTFVFTIPYENPA